MSDLRKESKPSSQRSIQVSCKTFVCVWLQSAAKLFCVHTWCPLLLSHPTSSSRKVLHEQHSEPKTGFCGRVAWNITALPPCPPPPWLKPWISIVSVRRSSAMNGGQCPLHPGVLALVGRVGSSAIAAAWNRGAPACGSEEFGLLAGGSQATSLQKLHMATLGWFRSRRTSSAILLTDSVLLLNCRVSSMTSIPRRS